MPTKTTSTTGKSEPKVHFTYWLTRDSDPDTGALSPNVRVWLAAPKRLELGRGAVWHAPGGDDDLFGEWPTFRYPTYPDDNRQCIRVEGDRERGPDDVLDPAIS